MIINTKRTTSRHMEIKMAKTKDKERLLKATRKGEATNNEVENPHKAINWLFSRNSAEQNTVAWYI